MDTTSSRATAGMGTTTAEMRVRVCVSTLCLFTATTSSGPSSKLALTIALAYLIQGSMLTCTQAKESSLQGAQEALGDTMTTQGAQAATTPGRLAQVLHLPLSGPTSSSASRTASQHQGLDPCDELLCAAGGDYGSSGRGTGSGQGYGEPAISACSAFTRAAVVSALQSCPCAASELSRLFVQAWLA